MTEQIRNIMKIRGMKQKDLADALGISTVNLSQRLSKDNFRTNELEKIAEILNCELKCFFVIKDNSTDNES